MQHIHYNIKISKELIKQCGNTSDKTIPVLSYLYFHTTPEKYIYTSIDCICEELHLSTKSHGTRRSQNIIREILKHLIDNNIISLIVMNGYTNIDDIKNGQLFKLLINTSANWINANSNYVYIDITEYQSILKCQKDICKVFNVYCNIKSHICMDDDCIHMCYPSMQTLCKLCACSDNTLINMLKALCENKLLYIYKLNNQEQVLINRDIKYIFALERYSKQDILNEFAA